MEALSEIMSNIPENGTPAEYVTWFANALAAVFSALKELFGNFKGLIGGDKGEEEGE